METFLADDGERLNVAVSGQGSPLLLLHGWTASHAVWSPFVETLGQRHRVYRPDARGHGGHGLTMMPTPDVGRLARDVANLLDHYGLEKVAVAGHSMGALTLWQAIRDQGGERFSHFCIIDQSPRLLTDEGWGNGIYGDFGAESSARLLAGLEEDFAEAVLRLIAFGRNAKARAGYEKNSKGWQQARLHLRKLDPAPLISIWKSLVVADYRDVLPLMNAPALLAWGEQSNFYGLETAKYLLQHLPDARLSSYEGADHCPQLYQPERFGAELLDFLTTR